MPLFTFNLNFPDAARVARHKAENLKLFQELRIAQTQVSDLTAANEAQAVQITNLKAALANQPQPPPRRTFSRSWMASTKTPPTSPPSSPRFRHLPPSPRRRRPLPPPPKRPTDTRPQCLRTGAGLSWPLTIYSKGKTCITATDVKRKTATELSVSATAAGAKLLLLVFCKTPWLETITAMVKSSSEKNTVAQRSSPELACVIVFSLMTWKRS